jgi:hypothetical protein
MLIALAYQEEGRSRPDKADGDELFPLIYPRSYVEGVAGLPREKTHDYCFLGAVFSPDVWSRRRWILDFARRRFTKDSILCISDAPAGYAPLGEFDRTLDRQMRRFNPKKTADSQKAYFDADYFGFMCRSRFTLCPAGDQPWSMRFFESILCRSIPILRRPIHAGRNAVERSIPYRHMLERDVHQYRPELTEANYRLFIERQTLLEHYPANNARIAASQVA